jgi:hypothetical protein
MGIALPKLINYAINIKLFWGKVEIWFARSRKKAFWPHPRRAVKRGRA